LDNKIRLWEQEDICYEAEQREISVFGEVVQKYAQALDSEPGNTEARKGLAELYWNRFVEAEQQRNKLQQIFYRDLLLFYDDGTYRHLLEGKVELMLDTAPRPDGTSAKIYRYEEAQRHLQAVLQHEVSIPCKHTLSVGSYLIVLTCEGYREVCCPIYLRRGEYFDITVQLYSDEEIGETYVYIPAGKFYFGGDTEASMSLPLRQQYLDDFFISRFPITFREYLVYLNEIHKTDPKQAEALCPRSDNEIYVKLNEHNEYIPDRAKLFDGIINQRYPEGSGAEWDLPILGVSWFESILYCRWRSQKEGRKVTLPTEEQWEKAASGADHRIYPWGNTFDATFCKMGRSRRPSEMQPEPIAVFIHDESPYGVRDIVGTISEWTLTLPQEEVDKLETDPEITPVQRGGGWVASGEQLMRIGSRLPRPGGTRTYNSGFRVVTYPPKYICPPTLHNLPYDYWQVNP
jgi:serine/threonine-protein kinase